MIRLKNEMLAMVRKVYAHNNKLEAGEQWRETYSTWLNCKYLFDDTNTTIIENELRITLNFFNSLN